MDGKRFAACNVRWTANRPIVTKNGSGVKLSNPFDPPALALQRIEKQAI
jgi:hypothetical protein